MCCTLQNLYLKVRNILHTYLGGPSERLKLSPATCLANFGCFQARLLKSACPQIRILDEKFYQISFKSFLLGFLGYDHKKWNLHCNILINNVDATRRRKAILGLKFQRTFGNNESREEPWHKGDKIGVFWLQHKLRNCYTLIYSVSCWVGSF